MLRGGSDKWECVLHIAQCQEVKLQYVMIAELPYVGTFQIKTILREKRFGMSGDVKNVTLIIKKA